MFKLESYITPIILSYVNKYINNFKPEDSQVSLWGGDATFNNLELNLEVLEQELQLPFSFVSGSIRALSIHVPWTKITSEPIKITINTIECILNLKGRGTRQTPKRKGRDKSSGQNKNIEAPPGYVQSLINKIVSNISIHCNNLILKYVEEDIVLSMNIKLLKFESANEKWEPAYTDLSPAQVVLRKVISISDLTLCLDKRNASGKIEVYQEPMLYRCSMTIHLLMNYHSATADLASTTRLDIYCNNMEFSMTEQQVPMLMRIIMLILALQQKQLKSDIDLASNTSGSSVDHKTAETQEGGNAGWTGWVWSYVTSVLPAPWEDEWNNEDLLGSKGHTLHIGFYVDHASITFKVSEANGERGYYSYKKIRYHPMLTLNLQGIYADTLIHGLNWFNCTGGVSEAILLPGGHCSCGHLEENESSTPYLKLGSASNSHKLESLFDAEAVENNGGKRQYFTSWDHHMTITTESVLLGKTPAFAFDFVHQIEIPSDKTSDILLDLGSNYEFSNLAENSALTLCIGPFRLRICSGLIHRCKTLQVAGSFYDYPPYFTPKLDLTLQDLLPPSEEDFDALNEFIPSKTTRITFFAPLIELELMDHPFFEPNKGCLYRRNKKLSFTSIPTSNLIVPKVTLECQFIDITQHSPLYENRLVHTTCQLPNPPEKLFVACFVTTSVKIVGLLSRLVTNSSCQSIMLTPSSVSFSLREILKPQYWVDPNIVHDEIVFESENLTLNGTKPKMLVVYKIIEKMFIKEPDIGKSIYSSSLLLDSCKDFGFPYMEIGIDGVRFKKVVTNSTQTIDFSIDSIRAFIFEPFKNGTENKTVSSSSIQQVLFLSGPEIKVNNSTKDLNDSKGNLQEDSPLFTMTVQFPLRPDVQKHPPILIFNLQEMKICVDPLMCKFLLYVPKNFLMSDLVFDIPSLTKTKSFTEANNSAAETPRRLSTNQLESVHSSSDHKIPQVISGILAIEEDVDIQEKVYNLLKTWFDVWKGMFLSGDISQCTVYFPMTSLSAIGSQGIQEAVEQAMSKENPPDILVITLPFANIKSAHRYNVTKILKHLPVTLDENIWSPDKSSFPWTMSVVDLSCYTIQKGEKLIFLKPVSLSATVGWSTRPSKSSTTIIPSKYDINDDKKEKLDTGSSLKKDLILSVEQKRKGSRNTDLSGAGSSNAQHGKSVSSSLPNSPHTHTKKTQKKNEQTLNSPIGQPTIDISYLGVCVHIDTAPIIISTSEVQVYLFASVLYGCMEVATNFFPNIDPKNTLVGKGIHEVPRPVFTKGSSTLSPTQLKDSTMDNVSDNTPPLNTAINSESLLENNDSVKLTAWIQWTITRFSIELLSGQDNSTQHGLKLVIDVEDIVSSLDFQSVYLKVKSKIGSASIQHYERSRQSGKWQPGKFSGIVMRLRDDLATSQRQEDNSLISITVTRASCQHTHTLWGAVQKKNRDNGKSEANIHLLSKSRYITEIVVNIQPIDFVVSLSTLRNFYFVLMPLITIFVHTPESHKLENVSSSSSFLSTVNNQTLPLAYIECQEIRVILPSKELLDSSTIHDTMIFQLQKIVLNPQAVNPICRAPIRSDIYDQAANARILNIPGSEVEDRQYQLDILGISVCTGTWSDINSILKPSNDLLSNLRGMSENPALEWNNLEQGQPNTIPNINLRYICEKFDITVVAAPAMIYKDNTTICGHSLEVNLVSDIFVNLSLQQIKLFSTLFTEFVAFLTPLIVEDGAFKKPVIKFPHSSLDSISERISEVEAPKQRDSGIETSDVSTQSIKAPGSNLFSRQNSESDKLIFPRPPSNLPFVYSLIPLEAVLTAGKIGLTLYNVQDERSNGNLKYKTKKKKVFKKTDDDQGYDASEESTDDRTDPYKRNIPLLYMCFTQPNAFFAKQQVGRKLQVSIFDVSLKMNSPEYSFINRIPIEEDFSINLLETMQGTPNPSNGILPAFFTFKYIKGVGKNSKIQFEILKPTKILCQVSKWSQLLSVKDKVLDTFRSGGGSESLNALLKDAEALKKKDTNFIARTKKTSDTYKKFQQIKDVLGTTNSVGLKFDQLILVVASESGHELQVGTRELRSQLFLSPRPEKICLMTTFDCLTLTVIYDNFKKLLLNPWTVTFDVCVFWESWQDLNSDPQIQVTAESDCIMIDVTAEHLKCLKMVLKDANEFAVLISNTSPEVNVEEAVENKIVDKDQHYKDDLRAGAFQFVNSNTDNPDEMPLPYQVMFWNKTISAMAWKYPQPRALTKVRVFPVPYKIALSTQENISVLCHLEYWSDCRNCYLPFTQFCLSESEICHLNLPNSRPKTLVASTWRVVITTIDDVTEQPLLNKGSISPRALAACMRIDSYFNKCLVPNLHVALYINRLETALYNLVPCSPSSIRIPECLQKYTPDFNYPEAQKFLTLSLENLSIFFSTWEFDSWIAELTTSIGSTILDYTYLTEQTFFEPFTTKLEISTSKGLNFDLISKPIQLKFGPSIAHTLAVSSQIFSQSYANDCKEIDFIITTRYVICNHTNVGIRFGQDGTEENILLLSRTFSLYAWRSQKKKQQLRICIEENGWIWSKPVAISKEGTDMIHFNSTRNVTVFVRVKNLSNTQKQIIFFGQLIVCNMLSEHFEMKITESASDNKEQEFRNAASHVVAGRSVNPSVFIDDRKVYFLRLRFYGLDSAWTGDIPLREHATGAQPWLVKVPLQERGQFLSIWCRIYIQDFTKSKRILAMLWPLFMVKSNLPMSVKAHIETLTLGVNLDSIVPGKGELMQLYCPGTIDHSHQITFELDEKNSNSTNPYVPLYYSLVDQREFFKKSSDEEFDVILESLKNCLVSKWPYLESEYNNVEWIMDESQPLTHVEIRYKNACQYSPTLLVELLPWCLMFNVLGTSVSLRLNSIELCRVPHQGITAPPRLEENFHLGVFSGNNWFFSGPLQLTKTDWSQSFYMPKINGNVPLEGSIRTCIKCDSHLCMISISSCLSNEIRLLRLASTHIFSNHLATQVHCICLAVPEGQTGFTMPKDIERHCFSVTPYSQKSNSGIPIMQWLMLKPDSDLSSTDYLLYIAFSIDLTAGWSCPIRIDKPLFRKAFSVQNTKFSLPVVLTAQEVKGQIYLSLHNDPRPQLIIENTTKASFYCGQSMPDDTFVIKECEHFKWIFKIPSLFSIFYNMPALCEKFPELPQNYFPEKISFAYGKDDKDLNLEWSAGVSIVNNNNLFLRVPYYGDVKLTIINAACITFLKIESVSQVEISARDIRVRLSMREKTESFIKVDSPRSYYEQHKQTNLGITDESIIRPVSAPSVSSISSLSQLPQAQQMHSKSPMMSIPSTEDSSSLYATSSKIQDLLVKTIPLKENWDYIKINIFIKSFSVTLISDTIENVGERRELISLICDDITVVAKQTEQLKVKFALSDIQIDNQLYSREPFDFPVVLIGQEKKPIKKQNILSLPMEVLLEDIDDKALILIECFLETWFNKACGKQFTGIKSMKITINPISCFVEDTYITQLMQYMKGFDIVNLILWSKQQIPQKIGPNSIAVNVPELVSWQCAILAQPLTVRTFIVNPISMLLSVHSSMKMYIALDQSPLHFGKFERRRVFTTSYRLGHALTMHYLSGAIFGAGWVVSSLELLGSPGGLARAMGTGLRDFVSLPCRGIVQGPMEFLKGITTGSASLMRHVTAGTLQSVTKLASSVARNLDRLTLDQEHQRRTEQQRRQRPQGVAQGFMQGMTNFGISLLGAVGGIAHHPLQSMMSSEASPKSLAAAVGLGIVGVFTKPLSGAAELLALTGQGLLQGAGWDSLPDPRNRPQILQIQLMGNSVVKYPWKLFEVTNTQILLVTEATSITPTSIFTPVSLILTLENFIIINLENDKVLKVILLDEISLIHSNNPTVLSLKHTPPKILKKDSENVDDEFAINMDPEMRARVADYVRSTTGLLNPPEDVSPHSGLSVSPLSSPNEIDAESSEGTTMNFYITSQKMKYFVCLLNLTTQQRDGKHFPVL